MFRRLSSSGGAGNVAVASNTWFVLVGDLSRASGDEDTEETCEALFGRTPQNLDMLAKEMARQSDDQASYKWIAVGTVFLPSNRRLEKNFAERSEDR